MKFAFYKAKSTLVDRLIQWWERGVYSHCEAILSMNDGLAECASSSPRDGGVRIKSIQLDPTNWDIIEAPGNEETVREWFQKNAGKPYDFLGIAGFLFRRIGSGKGTYFCSEAIGEALGIQEAWRFDPNSLYDLMVYASKK